MPDVSSAERVAHAAKAGLPRRSASESSLPRRSASELIRAKAGLFDVSTGTRAAMVALGFIPFLHMLATLVPLVLAASGRAGWRAAWLSLGILFLVPPLLVRLVAVGGPRPSGRIDLGSKAFLQWWVAAQCQVVFTRLPMIEELLRLVPGLYSLWLRLWGAKIGALVYWSPGVAILDRHLLCVGNRVIFGAGARINAHVLASDARGHAALHVAPITIGDDVLIGGYSLLLPGCEIAPGEVTPPFRSIHAFSRFEHGRRVPLDGAPSGPGL
jgi:hypothetical protein